MNEVIAQVRKRSRSGMEYWSIERETRIAGSPGVALPT
jgi:hypothetical protein